MDERVGPVPLVDTEVVGEREPGVWSQPIRAFNPWISGRRAPDEHERRVLRVEMGRLSDLVGSQRATDARPLRVRAAARRSRRVRRKRGTRQLTTAVEQVGVRGRAGRPSNR